VSNDWSQIFFSETSQFQHVSTPYDLDCPGAVHGHVGNGCVAPYSSHHNQLGGGLDPLLPCDRSDAWHQDRMGEFILIYAIYPLVNKRNYWKSPFLMGKLTISMPIFYSYVTNYQRVCNVVILWSFCGPPVNPMRASGESNGALLRIPFEKLKQVNFPVVIYVPQSQPVIHWKMAKWPRFNVSFGNRFRRLEHME
jgi:hypothetical protein